MIGVGAIIVRRQHGREQIAGAVTNLPQEGGLGRIAVPVTKDGDPATIGEPKAEDVDRVGGGMFAEPPFRSPIEPAAAEASGMIDPGHPAAQVAPGGGLDDVALQQGQGGGDRAGGDQARGRIGDRSVIFRQQANAVGESAALVVREGLPVRDLRQPRRLELRQAALSFPAKRGELDSREWADRVAETELGPGKPLGMLPHLSFE